MSNRLGNQALVLTVARAGTLFVSTLSLMLIARVQSLTEYGTYAQLLTVVNLATTLFSLGLANSVNFFLARAIDAAERRKFLSTYYFLHTIVCLLIGLLLLSIHPLIIKYFHNEYIGCFLYIMVLLPWTRLTINGISNILIVYGKTNQIVLYNFINAFFTLGAIAIVWKLNLSFSDYMLIFIIGEVFIAISIYVKVWRLEVFLVFNYSIGYIRNILKYSIPLGLASVVGTLSLELDKLMIGQWFSTEEFAIYTNAARELPLTLIATSLTAVLLPKVTRMIQMKRDVEAVALWSKTVELSFIFICFFSLICVVFANQVMLLLYSDKYISGVDVFRIYAIVLLLRMTYFGIILNAKGKTRVIFCSSIIALVINICLNYILLYCFGIIGPALSTLISIFAVNLLQLQYTAHNLKMPIVKIFPWRALVRVLMVNITVGCIIFYMYSELGLEFVSIFDFRIVCLMIIMVVVYGLVQKKRVMYLWSRINNFKAI